MCVVHIPYVRVRTCEAGDVIDVFTRVGDTCKVFDSAVARIRFRYSGMLPVRVYTMLDSTTAVISYVIVCLYGVLRRRLQSRADACDSGASSFTL